MYQHTGPNSGAILRLSNWSYMGKHVVVGGFSFVVIGLCFADMEEVDAVISSIGGTTANPQADSQGNINIIEAALKKGVRKFILITSIGCGDSKDATPPQVCLCPPMRGHEQGSCHSCNFQEMIPRHLPWGHRFMMS